MGFWSLLEISGENFFEAPEWVDLGGPRKANAPPEGPLADWKNIVGTGPFILTDYIVGNSVTFSRNPEYWAFDERYLDKRLPYIDSLKLAIIPDVATALAALRTGKVDIMGNIDVSQARSVAKTNPELVQMTYPGGAQNPLFRPDKPPFTDIRVRKAMQMAIDLKSIAEEYYFGVVDSTPCGLTTPIICNAGWGFAYIDWPQSLKEEYTYNLAKARQLMNEAGYPNGFKTNMIAPTTADTNLMQVVKSFLLQIGVDIEIRLMEPTAYMQFARGGKHDQMAWDAMGKNGAVTAPKIAINNFFSTDMANYGKVNDPVYDEIVKKFNASPTVDEAKEYFKQADKYALEQHWIIVMPITTKYTFSQPYLKGFKTSPFVGAGGFDGYWQWARFWVDK